MSNPYVLAGYLAAAFIIGAYVLHLLRRARVLGRALDERAAVLARTGPVPARTGPGDERAPL
jgi:hypothetical protein